MIEFITLSKTVKTAIVLEAKIGVTSRKIDVEVLQETLLRRNLYLRALSIFFIK